MPLIKKHKFRKVTHSIEHVERIEGLFYPSQKRLTILAGNSKVALNSALHEAAHAVGVPDHYLHDKDGYSITEDITDFLWRLGWRRVK